MSQTSTATPHPGSWWVTSTDADFCAAYAQQLPRLLTDREGMRLVDFTQSATASLRGSAMTRVFNLRPRPFHRQQISTPLGSHWSAR
jgi:hypothetical protein